MSRDAPWRTARKMWALHSGRSNEWYRIKNQTDGPTRVYIYDEIGYFGVGASDFVRDLADVNGPIEVHINSPGGEVWDGITIYNTLMSREGVTVIIDGLAASIASVIACAGNPTLVTKQGQMVIHDGHSMAIGNAADLRDLAAKLDKASDNIASIYADRTGGQQTRWRELMKVETTFAAQEMVDAGLADRILENGSNRPLHEMTDQWALDKVFQNAASVPYVGREQHRHVPMTGRHSHDHAAFGASDGDDGAHLHAHGHNNDANHDHTHDGTDSSDGSGPDSEYNEQQVKMLCQLLDIPFETVLNWDAAAAYAKCKSSGDFKSIAFEKSNDSDPDSAAHYGLPHHATPHGPPDKGGVIAALGRSNQVEHLKNKSSAIAHLKSHARSLGLPSGDEDGNQSTEELWNWSDEDLAVFTNALKGA